MHTFVLSDPSRCIGCRACEIACVKAHLGDYTGRVTRRQMPFAPRITVVHEAEVTAPIQCRQCEDAPCVSVCPAGAITHDGEVVRVDETRCFGCKACMAACPVGAMQVGHLPGKPDRLLAYKCDLCEDRDGGPACVAVCPANALKIMDGGELQRIAGGRRRHSALQVAFGQR